MLDSLGLPDTPMARRDNDKDDEVTLPKGLVLVAGGLFAIGAGFFVFNYVFALLFMLFKATVALGMIAGGGYLGYKLLTRDRALGEGESSRRKALPPADDFERKMRELEAMEKALDAEISGR